MSSPMTALTTLSPLLAMSGAASVGMPGDGGASFAPVLAALLAPVLGTGAPTERPALGITTLPGLPGGGGLEANDRPATPSLPVLNDGGMPLPPDGIALPIAATPVAPPKSDVIVALPIEYEEGTPATDGAAPMPQPITRQMPTVPALAVAAMPAEPLVAGVDGPQPAPTTAVPAPRLASPTPRPSRFAKADMVPDLSVSDEPANPAKPAAASPNMPVTPTVTAVENIPPPVAVAPQAVPASPAPVMPDSTPRAASDTSIEASLPGSRRLPSLVRTVPPIASPRSIVTADGQEPLAPASPAIRNRPAQPIADTDGVPIASASTSKVEIPPAATPAAAPIVAPKPAPRATRFASIAQTADPTRSAGPPPSSHTAEEPLPTAAPATRPASSTAMKSAQLTLAPIVRPTDQPAPQPGTPVAAQPPVVSASAPPAVAIDPPVRAVPAASIMQDVPQGSTTAAKAVAAAIAPVDAPREPVLTPVERTAAAPAPAAVAATVAIAAPAILPAFRAFGAALHRAAAAERRAPGAIEPPTAAAAPALATPLAAPAAPVDTTKPHWPEAMLARIEHIRDAQDAGDTRIRLHPDALGHIDVALRHEAGGVRVQLTAAEPATRALLADAQPRLQELAETRGLKLAGSSVDGGGQSLGGERDRRAPQTAQPPAAPRAPRPAATDSDPDTDTRLA